MNQAKLGQSSIEQDIERLRTLLNLGLDISTDNIQAGGSNWTTTSTGVWEDPGLSIALTPTRDVHCIALARLLMIHSAAPASVYARILYDGTTMAQALWQALSAGAGQYQTKILWGVAELAQDTSYTIKLQLQNNTAGTLSLHYYTVYTEFAVILAHKAVLA